MVFDPLSQRESAVINAREYRGRDKHLVRAAHGEPLAGTMLHRPRGTGVDGLQADAGTGATFERQKLFGQHDLPIAR